jgi:hypothetical protein
MKNTVNTKVIADMIGQQRAELNEIKNTLKYWEDQAKAAGLDTLEGDMFKVSIIQTERTTVNWKAVAERFEPSRQLLTANSTTNHVTSVRVSAYPK